MNPVHQIYRLLDVCGLVAPCYLRPHYGNPLAHLESDLQLDGHKRAQLSAIVRDRLQLNLNPSAVASCATVGDLARLFARRVPIG